MIFTFFENYYYYLIHVVVVVVVVVDESLTFKNNKNFIFLIQNAI
jgi:hypothetical protein